MISARFSRAFWLFVFLLLPAPVCAQTEYVLGVRDAYPDIFSVEIESAKTITTAAGERCFFFKYDAVVSEEIRGKAPSKLFSFYSESELLEGGRYLVLFSKEAALSYRVLPDIVSNIPKRKSECRKLRRGYLLIYTETHLIRDVWDGKKNVEAVQFSDRWADFPELKDGEEKPLIVDFDIVKKVFQ